MINIKIKTRPKPISKTQKKSTIDTQNIIGCQLKKIRKKLYEYIKIGIKLSSITFLLLI